MIANELLYNDIFNFALTAIENCENTGSVLWNLLATYPTLPATTLGEIVFKANLTACQNFNKYLYA